MVLGAGWSEAGYAIQVLLPILHEWERAYRPTALSSLYILGCKSVLVLYIFRLTGNPATWNFKYFIFPCPTSRPITNFPTFSWFPDLAGTISELLFQSRTLLKTGKKKKTDKIYFQPTLCGLEDTGHATKWDAFLFFPILKQNKNLGFSHVESGNWDIPIKSGWVAGLQ